MPELMERIEQCSRVEEDFVSPNQEKIGDKAANNEPKEAKKPRREESNGRGKKTLEGINTVFKDPIYKILPQIRDKPYFKWPLKLGGDPSTRDPKRFWSYHKEKAT